MRLRSFTRLGGSETSAWIYANMSEKSKAWNDRDLTSPVDVSSFAAENNTPQAEINVIGDFDIRNPDVKTQMNNIGFGGAGKVDVVITEFVLEGIDDLDMGDFLNACDSLLRGTRGRVIHMVTPDANTNIFQRSIKMNSWRNIRKSHYWMNPVAHIVKRGNR